MSKNSKAPDNAPSFYSEDDSEEDVLILDVEPGGEDRLDRFLATHCEDLSRSRLKKLIIDGQVQVNGADITSPSHKLGSGDQVTLMVPPPVDDTPQPEAIPLDVIFEDEHMLVINKPAGMVVHPAPGHYSGTLVNALLHHCGDSLSGIGGVRRPGIVHRLDKDTTGLMLVAKSDFAHKKLSAQLADRSLSRDYIAYIWGVPNMITGRIEASIGRHATQRQKMAVTSRKARHAVTYYKREQAYDKAAARLLCSLETGRTHQIRVHLTHHGYPLIGDPVYKIQLTKAQSLLNKAGYKEDAQAVILDFPRQALHAQHLKFIHPGSGEAMSFTAALPEDLVALEEALASIEG